MLALIDTRDAFRRLREEGGFSQKQADAIVDLFRDADEEVATRSDIEDLDKRLIQRIELFEDRLRTEMDAMEERLRWHLTTRIYGGAAFISVVLGILNYVMG
jgi:hypothetical protein